MSCASEQINMTMLPNRKFKDFLLGYFDLFSWWIHFNLIFAMQVSEKNDTVWYACRVNTAVQDMGCTQIVLYIVWVV